MHWHWQEKRQIFQTKAKTLRQNFMSLKKNVHTDTQWLELLSKSSAYKHADRALVLKSLRDFSYAYNWYSLHIHHCSQAQPEQMKNSQWKACLYHHSAITACSVLSSAMFRVEDREIALGGLFVENGCFEKMWWVDCDVSVRWSPTYVLSPGLDTHVDPSSLIKSFTRQWSTN